MAQNGTSFYEVQRLPLRRAAIMLAIPPCSTSVLVIWQVILGHPWGRHPMSNASVVGWTIFLWLVYIRLLTVRLVTEVRDGELRVALRGFWRSRRVPLAKIASVEVIKFDPIRDYGGYGIRSTREGQAYIASSGQGIRVKLSADSSLVIGSQRATVLAAVLTKR